MNKETFNFSGKYFLVTGASSGFGKTTSILLSKYGAKVITQTKINVPPIGVHNNLHN